MGIRYFIFYVMMSVHQYCQQHKRHQTHCTIFETKRKSRSSNTLHRSLLFPARKHLSTYIPANEVGRRVLLALTQQIICYQFTVEGTDFLFFNNEILGLDNFKQISTTLFVLNLNS